MPVFTCASRLPTRGGTCDDEGRTKVDVGAGGSCHHDSGGTARAQDVSTGTTPEREAIVVVHVINYAALSRGVLDEAKTRVAGIYDAIGVHLEWVVSEDALIQNRGGRLNLTVLLLSPDMAERKISAERIKDGVLGQAHAASGRAHVFCARIATMVGDPRYFAIPLGDVIAHEVGHLC